MTSRTTLLLDACLAAGLLVLFAWARWPSSEPPAPEGEQSPAPARPVSAADSSGPVTIGRDLPAERNDASSVQLGDASPASLRDTDVDGRLSMDAQGRLIIDRELRRLFDYLLAGATEQPIEALRARLRAIALTEGGESLALQVLEEFDRYLGYLSAESELGQRGMQDLQARLDALTALRRRHLGAATAEAYFGEEERYAQATLDRTQDADPAWREARRAATEQQRALEQTEQFEQLGLNAAQRWEEREALYGAEAADRLAELDTQQAAWDARMQDWARSRAALQADRSMTPEQQALAIQNLFESMFDEAERRRVEAMEGEGG